MNNESNELRQRISSLSDEELLKMVTLNVADYRQEALAYAKDELSKRGVSVSQENVQSLLTESRADEKYKGVGGWLLFFCLSLTVISPLYALFNIATALSQVSKFSTKFPNLATIIYIDSFLNIGLIGLGMYAGISLWRVKSHAVDIAKSFLIVIFVYGWVEYFVYSNINFSLQPQVNYQLRENVLSGILSEALRSTFYCGIWFVYLSVSKRVRATYSEKTNVDFLN